MVQADLVRSLDARLNVLLTDAEEADAGEVLYPSQYHMTANFLVHCMRFLTSIMTCLYI